MSIQVKLTLLLCSLIVMIIAAAGIFSTFLRAGTPIANVEVVLENIRSNIMIVSVVTLIVAGSISLLVFRRLAHPIKEIAEIAVNIRAGNLEQRIPVRSDDEIGKLAESLNGMIDKLNADISALKKLERMRSEFLGNVSHELRTPIFAIQGMLETLLQGALDDATVRKDFVQRALANTLRLNELLGDLIEISRIESGEMKMSFRYFSIYEFLERIVAEMEPAAQQRNITLELVVGNLSLETLGDKERLRQVMINLIDNAIKYNLPNGKVIVAYEQTDGVVRISVEDTGVGISPEHLPRVFERFYRVDKERSREAGGTGLGLAIVKHIVEAHGSVVEVHSEVNKGSKFSFTLKT